MPTDNKKKVVKPLNKPSKTLNKLQSEYMKKHSKNHTAKHNQYMIKLMKRGWCIEQAHKLTLKAIGK